MTKMRVLLIGVVVLTLLVFTAVTFAQTGDTDRDGVSNRIDHCPTVPGSPENHGCPLPDTGGIPDKDSDGVADFVDQCPDEAGTGFTEGCPIKTVPDATLVIQPANPQVVMVWENTTECRVGVPLTAAGKVNIREQSTTSSAIIGQLAPGEQFSPFFRDYDENNVVWFGGAPADGGSWGWVAGSVVIDNGQCVNLPMLVHADAGGNMFLTLNPSVLDGILGDSTPEPPSADLLFPDLLTWEGSHALVIKSEDGQTERSGSNHNNYMVFTLKEVIVAGFDTWPKPGDPHENPPPPPTSAPPLARGVSVVIQIIGVLVGSDAGPLPASPPPPTSAPPPTRTLPVLLVIADMNDDECATLGSDTCLSMMVLLPDFDDPQGQCSPDSDNARALPKLLEAAIKGKVFKKVEIHGTARSSDQQPELTLNLAGDGSVRPVGAEGDDGWDYGCSLVGFVPNGETEAMGDGSMRIGVETFVVLMPTE